MLSELLGQKFSLSDVLAHPQKTAPGRPLKIVQLCWMDSAGAGGAAYRLHAGLRSIDVDSTMLVLYKSVNDDSVLIPPLVYNGSILPSSGRVSFGAMAIVKNDRRWSLLASQYPGRKKTAELFTDPFADLRPSFIKEIRDADIVNLHWVAGMTDYPCFAREFAQKTIVWTMHDMNPFTGGCHYSDGCERYCESCGACPNLSSGTEEDASRYFLRIKAKAFARSDIHPVSPSCWLAECAQRSSLLKQFQCRVIPNGFPTSVFTPGGCEEIRARYSIPPDAKLVLFGAASISIERKGFRYLKEALDRLAADSSCPPGVTLGVFGAAADDGALNGLPFPVICFGHIAEPSLLAKIYSAADVYVLPTLADNLPNTLIEAMSCGCPSVAFKTGGVPDIIEHGRTGWLAEQRDVKGLIDGIKWVLSGAVPRAEMSALLRKKAMERYDEKVQALAYAELYEQIGRPDAEASQMAIKGDNAVLAKQWPQARTFYSDALDRKPAYAKALTGMGKVLLFENDATKALQYFGSAFESDPSSADTTRNLAECLIAAKSYKDALNTASIYLEANPVDKFMISLFAKIQALCIDQIIAVSKTDSSGFLKTSSRITAIVAADRGNEFIKSTVNDLVSQNRAGQFEIIVVAVSPEHGYFTFLDDLMIRAGNIKCVTPPHKISFYQAVNTGIRLALGEYCIFFAAGDRIHPDCISKLSTALDIDKSAAAAFGKTAVSGSLTQVFQDNFTGQNQAGIIDRSEIQSDAMTDEYALGPNVLWRRSLNNTYGYFDWLMKSGADQDLWLKIARDFTFTHIPEVTGTALIDDISKDRFPRTMKQFSNIRQKYRLFPFSFGDGVSLSPEEKSLMKANRALEEIIGLIEKGKHKEAVSRYDSTKNLFESLPESRRIQRIIEQIRKKNQ